VTSRSNEEQQAEGYVAGTGDVVNEREDAPSDSLGQPTAAVQDADDAALDAVQERAEELQSDRDPGSPAG
jgi:hypothetical protein